MPTLILVGGTHAGERIEVRDPHPPYINLYAKTEPHLFWPWTKPVAVDEQFEIENYEIVPLVPGTKGPIIGRINSFTWQEALLHVLENYRPDESHWIE